MYPYIPKQYQTNFSRSISLYCLNNSGEEISFSQLILLLFSTGRNYYEMNKAIVKELFLSPITIEREKIINRDDFYFLVEDAVRRYKLVNKTDFLDISTASEFLSELKYFPGKNIKSLSFYHDAAKVRIFFNNDEYILDFDFDDPSSVFISKNTDNYLMVKDCKLTELQKTLESFNA
jgi:hypothetical protein